jgi:hypothetical protein
MVEPKGIVRSFLPSDLGGQPTLIAVSSMTNEVCSS